ncbi:MAG: transcription antitermination factor NusB [Acidobacteria bacterium]|nr:MAG: transcription antitermination factor NusB [Acidobacteriota bacterium]
MEPASGGRSPFCRPHAKAPLKCRRGIRPDSTRCRCWGFWRIARAEKSTRAFANELFEGVVKSAAELDVVVSAHTENWRLERIALIDRAILRLGVYELRSDKAPRKVVVNEAVELAKTFSSEEAAGFVNGVLDSVLHALPEKVKQDGGS